MVVCHCAVVSDRAIRAAVANGAQDVDAVGARCEAGVACGGCIPGIEELLADAATAIREPGVVAARQAERRRVAHPHRVAVPAVA